MSHPTRNPNHLKIDSTGKYLNFHGYSMISLVDTDMSCVEKLLKNSGISEFFSPLPVSTYHMTVYNMWNIRRKTLMPCQQSWLDECEKNIKIHSKHVNFNVWKKQLLAPNPSTGWIFPNSVTCQPIITGIEHSKNLITDPFTIENIKVHVSKSIVLRFTIRDPNVAASLDTLRTKCTDLYGYDDSKLVYHITLGYLYKPIPADKMDVVKAELSKLQSLIDSEFSQGIAMAVPDVMMFTSMSNYFRYTEMNNDL